MSLALATKGILPDFTGTGTGTGPSTTVYVLESFDVEVAQEDIAVDLTVMNDISLDIGEISIDVDVDEEESTSVSFSDIDTITVEV